MANHVARSPTARWRRLGATCLLLAAACTERAPIMIGLAGPLSDPDGVPMLLAAQLAVAEVNAAGGIRGRPLALIARDDHGHPDSAALVAAQLRSSPAVAVIGHVGSATADAAARVYGQGGNPVPVLLPSATAPGLAGAGPHIFRVCPTDHAHGNALALWARAGLTLDRVAVIYRNDDYGRAMQRAFRTTFERRGGTVTGDVPFLDAAADLGPFLDLLVRDGQPQALMIAGDRAEVLAILEQAEGRGLSLPVLGGEALLGIEAAGPMSEGIHLSLSWLPDGRRPAARTLLEVWARSHPERPAPNQPAAATWDIIHLLADALRLSGPDRARLQEALADLGNATPAHEGAIGSIGFTPEGNLLSEAVDMGVVRNGRVVRAAPR